MKRLLVVWTAVYMAALGSGCGKESDIDQQPASETEATALQLLDVVAPDIWTSGTQITVSLLVAGELPSAVQLLVFESGGVEPVAQWTADSADPLRPHFSVEDGLLRTMGDGEQQIELAVSAGEVISNRVSVTAEFLETLSPSLDETDYSVRVADAILLQMQEMLFPGEGNVVAAFSGEFVADSGEAQPLEFVSPVEIVQRDDRTLAWWNIASDITSLQTGRLTGTLQLRVISSSGAEYDARSESISVLFVSPDLLVVPGSASTIPVGGSVHFTGGGFPRDEQVVAEVDIQGEVRGADGIVRDVSFRGRPVAEASPGTARVFLQPELVDGAFVTDFPGVAAGEFSGTAQLVLRGADGEIRSEPTPLSFAVDGVTQYVRIEFSAGFYAALQRFGLLAVAGRIEARVLEHLQEIYSGISLRVVDELPSDISERVVTVLEITGTDPNGIGLFGYDNSPGKDVGNLRLNEFVGGANAATQADGAPGYGGVFVESFLYWSETARRELPPLTGAPAPDADFESLFASFVVTAATVNEAYGQGGRIDALQSAIDALGSLVAETAAHEIGHALGLANPEDPDGSFHNATDGAGCLMDDGDSRPPGERMGLEGFARTRLCDEERAYLEQILP